MYNMQLSLNISSKQTLEQQQHLIQNLETHFNMITEITTSYKKDDPRLIIEISELYLDSNKNLDRETIIKSLTFASKAHINDFRDNGVPYSAHPFQVGYIVAEWGLCQNAVIVANLHDVLEHSKPENKDENMNSVYNIFGREVLIAVSGLSGNLNKKLIEDLKERKTKLYNRLDEFNTRFKIDYLDYVKAADGITNLYTKKAMLGKDGLTAEERQEAYCNTAKKHLMPIARRLDKKGELELNLVHYINELIDR